MRQFHFVELIANYDFPIQYFLGNGNVVANALSLKSLTLACLCGEWAVIDEFRDLDVVIEYGQ